MAMSSSFVLGTRPCDEMKMGDGVDCLGIGVIVKGWDNDGIMNESTGVF